jgi:hypothetical protein
MNLLKPTLLIAALGVLPMVTTPATARAGITMDFGNVAIGYRDGYRDRDHRYHRWAHRQDADAYRNRYHDNYRDMTHDRDRSWNR